MRKSGILKSVPMTDRGGQCVSDRTLTASDREKKRHLSSRLAAIAFALVATAVAVLAPASEMGKVYADEARHRNYSVTFGPNETSVFLEYYSVLLDPSLADTTGLDPFIYTKEDDALFLYCDLNVPDGIYNKSIYFGFDAGLYYHINIKVQRGTANPDPANPTNNGTGGKVTNDTTPPHTCHFEWVTETEATETSDGVEVLQCPVCGKIAGRNYTSGSGILIGNIMSKIANAPAGGTVTIDTTYLTCFPKSVFDALAARPDVTLVVNYTYEHVNYTMTIPAGASQIPGVVDENGYAGFRRIAAYFLTTTR